MNKKYLLAIAVGLLLSFSGFAQSDQNTQPESKGNFFFSGGVYNGFFSGGPIVPFRNFEIKKLFAAMVGGYYEMPYGSGNAFFGLDVGYSSGSRFGGSGGVDFIPIDLTAAYVFPLTSFFYVGPRLKLGGLGLLGPDWNKIVLTAGARLDAELRSTSFPFGLYVAGGLDLFPTAPELAVLPVIEAGLRYPRGKFTWFGSSDAKSKEPIKTDISGSRDDSSGMIATAPATVVPATPAPTTPAQSVPDPVAPVAPPQNVPAPVVPDPVTPTPVAPPPVAPPQNVPAPVVPDPVTPTPVAPPPVAPSPVTPPPPPPTPVPLPPVTPTPAAPPIVTPPPAAPTPIIIAPAIPAPTAPVSVAPGTPGRSITLEDGRQGLLNSIYFEPDTAVLIETYRPILEAVGKQLAADPSLKVLLRAYAADFGTSDGRYLVSVDRARFSRDFFTGQYGVSPSRFSIEAYGSDKTPIYATEDWESHRCVELILFRE